MPRPRILSVGQCGYDHGRISRLLETRHEADVLAASTHGEALAALRASEFDLVLVNRIGDRDGASGLELIRIVKSDPATSSVVVMLVSNYADAQAEAVAIGALPGFGKDDLGGGGPLAAVEAALASSK